MAEVPRRAIVLAAGLGSRLRPLTDLRPKPLVEVNGMPILHNALRNLEAIGVGEVTVVVGYRKDAIQYACGSRFGGVEINYVESTVFDRTGSAYSLWLAREVLLSGDCLLLEGDVFFEQDALRRLSGAASDVAAVAPFEKSMEGSAALLSDDGFITAFRMKQTAANIITAGPQLFKTMNLLRFSGSALKATIVPALDDVIGSGARQAYTEELLGYLVERRGLQLAAARCDGLRWCEIDTAEDLHLAERIFSRAHAARQSYDQRDQ
ncbi:NDP-sugar pyrophosphorylase family protein [Bradyrhizobium japonicum]